MAGNYDKQVLIARELFLNYNQAEMIEKYHLKQDADYLYLPLLNHMSRISRKTGIVEVCHETSAYEECLDYNTVMTIYDVLCYPKETPVLAHQWVPLANLQVTLSSPSANIFSQKYADAFSGRTNRLWNVCQMIGGRKPEIMAGADVCWEFDVFPFFPVQFRFWDKDDEFPAQIKLLWDKNALKFMHFETTYYAMHILLNEILNAMKKGAVGKY